MAHNRQPLYENGEENIFSHAADDEFHINFGIHGSIRLSKAALQKFPTSLLSITLLGDGIEEHDLYLPIGCGHESFPQLIQDMYNVGAPAQIPPLGLRFDLFVKWLKYLGLATPGRGLSIETEAHKRVSFFVEIMLLSVKAGFGGWEGPPSLHITEESCSKDFICMPVDIKRYISDLVPFEFARRGIQVTVQQFPRRKVKEGDANLSKIEPYPMGESEVLIRRSFLNEPGSVTGVYKLSDDQKSPFCFQHGGHAYELWWSSELDDEGYAQIAVMQLDAGCCYDGRENIEHFVALPRGETDFIEEYKCGGMVYSREKHGKSMLDEEDVTENVPFLLLHGVSLLAAVTPQEFEGACLIVVESESLPFCGYLCEQAGSDNIESIVWRFSLEESPEWALHSDGQPPLP